MSLKALLWAWNQKGISASEKLVLLGLAQYAGIDNESCFPSQSRLAEECGMTRRAVINSLAALRARNLVDIRHRVREDGSYTSNLYTLMIDANNALPSEPRSQGVVNQLQGGSEPRSHHESVNGTSKDLTELLIPERFQEFHSELLGATGYEPTPSLWKWLEENVPADFDILGEAIAIREWCNKNNKPASFGRIRNWLKRPKENYERSSQNQRGNAFERRDAGTYLKGLTQDDLRKRGILIE